MDDDEEYGEEEEYGDPYAQHMGQECPHDDTMTDGGKTVCRLCGRVLETNNLSLEVTFDSSGGGAIGKFIPAAGRRNRAIGGVSRCECLCCCSPDAMLARDEAAVPCPSPCPNTRLSKDGDPVFPYFWAFVGIIGLVVPMEQRM